MRLGLCGVALLSGLAGCSGSSPVVSGWVADAYRKVDGTEVREGICGEGKAGSAIVKSCLRPWRRIAYYTAARNGPVGPPESTFVTMDTLVASNLCAQLVPSNWHVKITKDGTILIDEKLSKFTLATQPQRVGCYAATPADLRLQTVDGERFWFNAGVRLDAFSRVEPGVYVVTTTYLLDPTVSTTVTLRVYR